MKTFWLHYDLDFRLLFIILTLLLQEMPDMTIYK